MSNRTKPTLYASLIGPLSGLYLPLPHHDNCAARVALNSSSLARLWCPIYTRDELPEDAIVLDDGFARKLDFDAHAVYVATNP